MFGSRQLNCNGMLRFFRFKDALQLGLGKIVGISLQPKESPLRILLFCIF